MKEKIAGFSILANIILAGGKITVGVFSNSIAVLAAGIDSLVDVFASLIGYIGIKISGKPADEGHPYGHYKFEVLAGAIITLIVMATGFGIIYDAYGKLFEERSVNVSYLAFGVMIFSVLVNELMSRIKIYYGKKENSVSLLSDGIHSRIDVWTSLAVFFGLFLTNYWIYADSVLALLIGIYIIKESFSIGKDIVGSLLDVSAGKEVEKEIMSVASSQNIEVFSLKTQKKGSAITANLEIKLPKDLSVEKATGISNKLREALTKKIESLQYVAIQIESHELETGFYKPEFGKAFGWQHREKFKDKVEDAKGKGPSGFCVCPECGYKVIHERGVPCSSLKCPKCNIDLKRE